MSDMYLQREVRLLRRQLDECQSKCERQEESIKALADCLMEASTAMADQANIITKIPQQLSELKQKKRGLYVVK